MILKSLLRTVAVVACLLCPGEMLPISSLACAEQPKRPPNVVMILVDDLGYSDIGCYGGEIQTPNLDRLAENGLRFTQFYNTARCWPTRGALLTGYYAQQIARDKLPTVPGGGNGKRPSWARLLPDYLKPAGYRCYHSGKWHIDGKVIDGGFDRSLDMRNQGNYFTSKNNLIDDQPVDTSAENADYYATTATVDHAISCLQEHATQYADRPFFQYIAFIAPHFPLHARPEDIAKYEGRYEQGWEAMRKERHGRQLAMNLLNTPLSEVEADVGPPYHFPAALEKLGAAEVNRLLPWSSLNAEQRKFQSTKMAIHAAMVDAVDQEIGRLLQQLESMQALEDTLILFASDNGASAEIMVRDGGHDPQAAPGSAASYLCLGPGFSSACNTPFRRHKTWVHEGGISTPLIVHWPKGIQDKNALRHTPAHVIDFVPTVLQLAGIEKPGEWNGRPIPPAPGKSLVPALQQDVNIDRECLWWLHEGNRAVRVGDWKLVASANSKWELYNLAVDRAEQNNLADTMPEKVQELETMWQRQTQDFTQLARSNRPNVLFIAIDDQNDWCGPLSGHPLARTPQLDRLAARGTTFTNAHCNAPLCNPSRASLLLGLRPSTTGIYGLNPSFRSVPQYADRVTLPQHFARHGYETFGVGKIFHQGTTSRVRGQNNRGEAEPDKAEPEFMKTGSAGGVGIKPPSKLIGPTPMGDHPLMDWGTFEHEDQQKGDYQVASQAIEQIKSSKGDKPFFIAAGFFLPHVPCYISSKWYNQFPDDPSVLPLILEDDRADTPRFSWYLHWSLPEPRLQWLKDNNQWINLARSYLASTSFVDAQVGRLLDALDEAGLTENTIVVVWGDHGWHIGEKGITGKNSLWDDGTRVPLIWAGPGVSAAAICDQPAELLDIFPTLNDLCGLPAIDDLEGLSLTPQLRKANTIRKRPALTTHNQGNHAIRSHRYRYIRYADGSEEFYDHANDPHEWHNVINAPQYTSEIEQHRRWLPKLDRPPVPGSAHRILTYDVDSDTAVWENQPIDRGAAIPQ